MGLTIRLFHVYIAIRNGIQPWKTGIDHWIGFFSKKGHGYPWIMGIHLCLHYGLCDQKIVCGSAWDRGYPHSWMWQTMVNQRIWGDPTFKQTHPNLVDMASTQYITQVLRALDLHQGSSYLFILLAYQNTKREDRWLLGSWGWSVFLAPRNHQRQAHANGHHREPPVFGQFEWTTLSTTLLYSS